LPFKDVPNISTYFSTCNIHKFHRLPIKTTDKEKKINIVSHRYGGDILCQI
jgi:hypothetical protein